ncbi:pentapeptide repeat-containing protein [Marinicrinis lubricantis]|uniref:Pentapeptide repeat-containing protein n=1 Tax=Marinicrinis lubricantis TaxID=2086470 RepID=A0ABW1IRW4_9BACL
MREEAMLHFEKHVVQPRVRETLLSLERDYDARSDGWTSGFVEAFRNVCLQARKRQKEAGKAPIAYITFSMLRTALADGRDVYLVEAADQRWFLDREPSFGSYDVSWAFRYVRRLREQLRLEAPAYKGAIVEPDVDRIILREAVKFHQYVVRLGRKAMEHAARLPEFLELERAEEVEVRIGEYWDASEVVFKEDRRPRKDKAVKAWLEERKEYTYAYEAFEKLDLAGGDYSRNDLRYAWFRSCRLSRSRLEQCVLIGTSFGRSDLEGSDLSGSLIHGADFSGCRLEGARLKGTLGAKGLTDPAHWDMPGYPAVRFVEADLTGADLSEADLRGAVFTNARLDDAQWQGARMDGAVLPASYREILPLSDEQRQAVIWMD